MSGLYPFQQALLDGASAHFRAGTRAVVLQVGTGGGKTHTAAHAIRTAIGRGLRVAFAADLDAIGDDTERRLREFGLHVGRVQADRPADPTAPVQVCSLQTLARRGDRPPADLVVIDECHIACARTTREVLAAYPSAWLLGLTATPQRGDGQPLGDVFKAMVCGPSNAELTRDGYLVPCEMVGPKTTGRALACDPLEGYRRWGDDRRAIVFCASVPAAMELAQRFVAAGVVAECVTGETPRRVRRDLRDRIASGATRVVCSVDVLTKGWDCPSVEVALFARSFGVVGTWLQGLGRISRAFPGKTRCTAIDLCGSWIELGLRDDPRVWSLDGDAVRRANPLPAMSRCAECAAVFSPAAACPRCGARLERIERVPMPMLTRAETLARVEHLPLAERDRRYLARLEQIARDRLRKSGDGARVWALAKFKAARGRDPEAAA